MLQLFSQHQLPAKRGERGRRVCPKEQQQLVQYNDSADLNLEAPAQDVSTLLETPHWEAMMAKRRPKDRKLVKAARGKLFAITSARPFSSTPNALLWSSQDESCFGRCVNTTREDPRILYWWVIQGQTDRDPHTGQGPRLPSQASHCEVNKAL